MSKVKPALMTLPEVCKYLHLPYLNSVEVLNSINLQPILKSKWKGEWLWGNSHRMYLRKDVEAAKAYLEWREQCKEKYYQ
jgi:hypothetical protein